MKNEASEIEIRAIREMGKLIEQGQERGEIAKPEDGYKYGTCNSGEQVPQTLSQIGVSRKESSTSKNLASIDEAGDTISRRMILYYP